MEKNNLLLSKINCWVITEGLIGTENQCLGVAEALGLAPKVLRLSLKQPWKTLSPWLGFEHADVFSPTLPDDDLPDMVIASGRKAIAAARFIKRASKGRSFTVFIQDPKVSPKNFDLVLAPMHDSVEGKNVVKTIAAPNRITEEKLRAERKNFPNLCALPLPHVAVMIGGNSKTHMLSDKVLDRLILQVKALEAKGVGLMVTPSRRTPDRAVIALRKALAGSIDKGQTYFWDMQGPSPYFAMLDAADFALVSNDSASMLSEAATAGVPVYSLPMEARNKGKRSRLESLEQRLIEYGAVRPFDGKLESWDYIPLNDAGQAAKIIAQRFTKFQQGSI